MLSNYRAASSYLPDSHMVNHPFSDARLFLFWISVFIQQKLFLSRTYGFGIWVINLYFSQKHYIQHHVQMEYLCPIQCTSHALPSLPHLCMVQRDIKYSFTDRLASQGYTIDKVY